MMRTTSRTGWRYALGIAISFALVLAMASLPVSAKSKAPERAVGGPTLAERLAKMQAIHEDVAAGLPRGHGDSPVFVEITQEDRDAVDNPVTVGRQPLRIGVVKEVSTVVGRPTGRPDFSPGVSEVKADGSFVWAVDISSPGAQAIRVHIEGFSAPRGVELYLLGDDMQADGPHVGRGRNGNGDFWTRSINGDRGTLVLRSTGKVPNLDRALGNFRVTEVAHVRGRPIRPTYQSHDSWPCSDNATCVVDAECGNTGAATQEAIAKMEWIRGPFVNTCTGGLIADTDGSSQIPYFLSANHCLNKSNSSMETWFMYTTSGCNGTCPHNILTGGAPPSDTVGMTVNATGTDGDYTLMTLNGTPPAGSIFLGWTTTAIAFDQGAALHRVSNPNFGPQAYSQHSVNTTSGTCLNTARGAWIYSDDVTGATMGGSSGSPVVNAAGQIVGQLTGCCGSNCGDVCDSGSNRTIDGALAHYFSNVESFLDPQGGGGCSTNGECDDGQFCNGAETCSGGTCQSGSDPCPGQGCDETNDVCINCGGNKAQCSSNADCCSNNCRNGACKGN